jgi:hypothetical protein
VDLQRLSSQASQLQAAISGLQEARAAREKAQQGDRAYLQVRALQASPLISPDPDMAGGLAGCLRPSWPTYPCHGGGSCAWGDELPAPPLPVQVRQAQQMAGVVQRKRQELSAKLERLQVGG